MEDDFDTNNFQGMQKQLEKNDDLNSIFQTLTGFRYDVDTKEFIQIDGVELKYCPTLTSRLFDYTTKSLTNYTKLTKNNPDVIAFKSALTYAGECKIFSNFDHDCELLEEKESYYYTYQTIMDDKTGKIKRNKKGKIIQKEIKIITKFSSGNCLIGKEPQDFEIIIEGLWKVVDDSYRQGIKGFMADNLFKNHNINENRNVRIGPKKETRTLNVFGKEIQLGSKDIEDEEVEGEE